MFNDGYILVSLTKIYKILCICGCVCVKEQYMTTNCYNYHCGSVNNIKSSQVSFKLLLIIFLHIIIIEVRIIILDVCVCDGGGTHFVFYT